MTRTPTTTVTAIAIAIEAAALAFVWGVFPGGRRSDIASGMLPSLLRSPLR
jgi:hypothetical protein